MRWLWFPLQFSIHIFDCNLQMLVIVQNMTKLVPIAKSFPPFSVNSDNYCSSFKLKEWSSSSSWPQKSLWSWSSWFAQGLYSRHEDHESPKTSLFTKVLFIIWHLFPSKHHDHRQAIIIISIILVIIVITIINLKRIIIPKDCGAEVETIIYIIGSSLSSLSSSWSST